MRKIIPPIATLAVIALLSMGSMAVADDVKTVPRTPTYLGKTAQQWHARAVYRTKQRNATRAQLRHSRKQTVLAKQALRQTLSADLYGTHWIERAFLCIHAGEGAWNDPNAPYYGGLQMDSSFQRTYGGEFYAKFGTADHWPISVQIAVAIKAFLSGRGFYPWPHTARVCGLIP